MSEAEAEFSPDESRALASVLDTLVPPCPERGLPGAGELGLAPRIDARAPELRGPVRSALGALERLAAERGEAGFAALAPDAREAVLRRVAELEPALLPGLVFHTYAIYYSEPRVARALGIESWPPFPAGYTLETGDLRSLERLKSGPRRYR